MLIGQSVGPFRIESELGSGAMGTVYKAQYTKDNGRTIPVALKVVSLGLLGNDSAMARFEREASILKQLRHPHIVRLLATGRYQKTPFIAMEFVDGESLEKTLARRQRLDWDEVVSYGKQLCEALQHAHDKGIVHRDLKPSNLMVTTDGTLKLTDFGIAKDTDVTALTGLNSTIGTAAYMSPEQCRGDKTLGPKSDLYSLGCCLYELLTGMKTFTAESTVDLFLKHCNETPTRPRRVAPETPVWLDNLVMFCLEKNKENRPLDAATIGRMLGEIEDKVRSNQSVGAEVANARRIDRPVGKVADADRDAARELRGTTQKKKKKKPAAAAAKPPWKLAVLVLVPILLLLGYAGYSLMPQGKPPETAEQAFERVAAVEGDPDDRIRAANGFRNRFPDSPFDDKARGIVRDAQTDQIEKGMLNRVKRDFAVNNSEGFDKATYDSAIKALKAEDAGDLTAALDLWKQTRSSAPPAPADGSTPSEDQLKSVSLGWLAARHLRIIGDDLPALLKRLKDKIATDELYELDPAFNPTDPESLAVRAVKLERFGDRTKARATWDRVALATRGEPTQVNYLLLALKQAAVNKLEKSPTVDERAKPVAAQLTAQDAALAQTPNRAVAERELRNLCRAIVSVYADEPDPAFATLTEQARTLLGKYPKN